MELELHVVDVVHDHKIKMEKMRLKIRKYAIDSEAWYHYAVGSIVTLVGILIAFVAVVGLRVPAKPLRFELWGAHEDLSPPSSRSHHDLKA